jgi:hypothetical protein
LRLALCLGTCSSVDITSAGSVMNKNLLVCYAIHAEELCQYVDPFIMPTACDLHFLQVSGHEQTCLCIEVHSALVGLMQNNEIVLWIEDVLKKINSLAL